MSPNQCAIRECNGPRIAVGLCWKHYKRLKRHGDAGITMRRHKQPHECRSCGSKDPAHFYPGYRGICKACQKVRTIQRVNVDAGKTALEKLVTSLGCADGARRYRHETP